MRLQYLYSPCCSGELLPLSSLSTLGRSPPTRLLWAHISGDSYSFLVCIKLFYLGVIGNL